MMAQCALRGSTRTYPVYTGRPLKMVGWKPSRACMALFIFAVCCGRQAGGGRVGGCRAGEQAGGLEPKAGRAGATQQWRTGACSRPRPRCAHAPRQRAQTLRGWPPRRARAPGRPGWHPAASPPRACKGAGQRGGTLAAGAHGMLGGRGGACTLGASAHGACWSGPHAPVRQPQRAAEQRGAREDVEVPGDGGQGL